MAFPPATPLTDQVSGLVVMEGVNCWVDPARTFAVLGEIVSVSPTGGPGEVYPFGESAQLDVINVKKIKATVAIPKNDERRTGPPQAGQIRLQSKLVKSANVGPASLENCNPTRRHVRARG